MNSLRITTGVLILLSACGTLISGQSPTPSPSPGGAASEQIQRMSQVSRRPKITKKPVPGYTEVARFNNIQGIVVLRCVFRSTGKVTDISIVRGLPNGLTERAVEAAKKIKFTPAMKDGRAVSVWMQLEYNFFLE